MQVHLKNRLRWSKNLSHSPIWHYKLILIFSSVPCGEAPNCNKQPKSAGPEQNTFVLCKFQLKATRWRLWKTLKRHANNEISTVLRWDLFLFVMPVTFSLRLLSVKHFWIQNATLFDTKWTTYRAITVLNNYAREITKNDIKRKPTPCSSPWVFFGSEFL